MESGARMSRSTLYSSASPQSVRSPEAITRSGLRGKPSSVATAASSMALVSTRP